MKSKIKIGGGGGNRTRAISIKKQYVTGLRCLDVDRIKVLYWQQIYIFSSVIVEIRTAVYRCDSTYSFRASSIRVCHPGPLDLK